MNVRADEMALVPLTYHLKIVYIFEADVPELIFVVEQSGFKSVEALKNWIEGLPAGTTLEFNMSCRRMGIEPLDPRAEPLGVDKFAWTGYATHKLSVGIFAVEVVDQLEDTLQSFGGHGRSSGRRHTWRRGPANGGNQPLVIARAVAAQPREELGIALEEFFYVHTAIRRTVFSEVPT